jgi:regulator of sigma E protease
MAQLAGLSRLFEQRTLEGLKGPVGMGEMMAEQARRGVSDYLRMLMLLSVALGMFNLLPFPALDGGRLVFLGYEVITRRRPNQQFEAVVHFVGLLLLLGVLVLVTFRDVAG